MHQDRERFDSKLERLEMTLTQRDDKIDSLEHKVFSENKLRNLIGEEIKDFHEIVDDACGRISMLENNKESSDQAILKVRKISSLHELYYLIIKFYISILDVFGPGEFKFPYNF